MIPCPKCGPVAIRELAVGKRTRAECSGCGRFVGWADSPRAVVVAAAPPPPPAVPDEVGSPQAWLYVTRRLDLDWFPAAPLWSAAAVSVASGGAAAVYYRLTANVLAWLDLAGVALERDALAGKLPRGQLDAYLDAMAVVWRFADENLSPEAIRRARKMVEAAATGGAVPELPEAPRPV